MTVGRLMMLTGVWAGCADATTPAAPRDIPNTVAVIAIDTPDGEFDSVASECSPHTVIDAFQTIRPPLRACASCHDMTAPPSVLKAPGPPWFHPNSDAACIAAILTLGLVDAEIPAQSLFVLKPLDRGSGGAKHAGGSWFSSKEPPYDAFLTFLELVRQCSAADFDDLAGVGR